MRLTIGIKLGLCLGLLATASAGLTGYYAYERGRHLLIEASKEKLLTATQVSAHRFDDTLKATASDVSFLRSLSLCINIAQDPVDTIKPSFYKNQLAEIFVHLLQTHAEYSQIRLISTRHHGKELVRVDKDRDSIKIIDAHQLQEKNHFPYVFETMRLAADQIYTSQINLNQELGTHLGYGKPTVRIAAPIKTDDGNNLAVIVINVDLDNLFKTLAADIPNDLQLLLTNNKGDYLLHPEPEKSFGFERGRTFLIQDDIANIQPLLEGQMEHTVLMNYGNNNFGGPLLAAFIKQPFGYGTDKRFILLGLYTPLENVLLESKTLWQQIIEITFLFSLLAGIVSFALAQILIKPIKSIAEAISRFELGQTLTAIPSHRRDEIGYLANSFLSMTNQLNQQITNLHASEAKLHAILDNAPISIWLFGINHRYLFVNRTFCKTLDICESHLLNSPPSSSTSADTTISRLRKADYHCLVDTSPTCLYHETLVNNDNDYRILEITRTKLQGLDGETLGVIGIATDITESRRAADYERAQNHVLELLANDATLSELLTAIVLGMETQNPLLIGSILLLDVDNQHLLTGAAPSLPDFYNNAIHGLKIAHGNGACGAAVLSRQRLIVEDISRHPDWTNYREVAIQAGLAACWSEPIFNAAGKLLGTLATYRTQISAPTARDIQIIEQAVNLAGIAINHHNAHEDLQLASSVYQNSSEAMAVTDAHGAILTINPAFTQMTGYSLNEVINKNLVALSGEDQDYRHHQTIWHAINTTGHWKGEVWDRRKNGETFAEQLTINTIYDDHHTPYRRVALFSDITQKKQSEKLIWTQANIDPLTGLPNRRMFHDRLDQEIKKAHRSGLPVALIFLDLDRFKEVNDTLGHDMGDILLQDAAQRLQHCVRESDTVARLGGDEFTIILGELENTESVSRIIDDILKSLAEPFNLKTKVAYLSASIGITLYPQDGTQSDILIKNADQAMYAAKHQGRNRYCYFTPSMQEAALARMEIASALRRALAADEFQLYYQPIVELSSGAIHKAEALLRWQHASRGMINPAEFIPIAEDIGMISDMGSWVFRLAAKQVSQWREQYYPHFQISINKSPVQFFAGNSHHAHWLEYLHQLKLPGSSIVVEITEGLLLDASNTVKDQLLAFRDAGIQVSLDDFGTGYSSLAYLKKFDIDYLKIDRSFVSNLNTNSSDLVLCEAIIVMAHKLGIKVIAEGIETELQRQLLLNAGCDYGQGFLFSRPVTATAFEALLATQSAEGQAH